MKRPPVKKHIVETASELFYQNGYNLTGINEIIAEAGIAKATLYHHFKSKEEICLAYLTQMQARFMANITEFVESKPKGKQRLLAIFDYVDQFYNEKGFNGCWCINTISELPREDKRIRSEIRAQKLDFLRLITNYITEGYDSMRKPKREALARQIYLLYESAVSESHLHGDSWPITTAKSMCKQLLI